MVVSFLVGISEVGAAPDRLNVPRTAAVAQIVSLNDSFQLSSGTMLQFCAF